MEAINQTILDQLPRGSMVIQNTTFQYLILAIVASLAILVIALVIIFGTGVGRRVVQRIRQRWRYKYGKHVNVIMLFNNHVSRELFLPKEADGSFKVDGKRYNINPLATFIHDGIPTQINHEGIAEPYNIFNEKDAEKMSTAELENIIMNNEGVGIADLLKKLIFWVVILGGIAVILTGVSVYYNYQLHDFIIKKGALKDSIVAGVQAAQYAFQNATMVVPR